MSTETSSVPPPAAEDRTVAILSYLTLIGFVVAIVLHSSKPTRLGAFHLRQTLGVIIAGLVLGVSLTVVGFILAFIPVVGPLLMMLIWISLSVAGLGAWIFGIITAVQGQEKPIPVIGEPIQKWFANTFK